VVAVGSADLALNELSHRAYELMMLDLKMPGMTGLELLQRISGQYPEMAVIIMTAYGSMDTAIQAIRHQVLDYLLKPIAPADIVAAVERALLENSRIISEREEKARLDAGEKQVDQLLLGKDVVLHLQKRILEWHESIISLTATEAKLLTVLIDNRGKVVSNADLVGLVQGYHVGMEEAGKILRPVMCRLRNKLTCLPNGRNWIKNVRGAGYIFEVE
jgi:DNA-binding response OmpR family regulator